MTSNCTRCGKARVVSRTWKEEVGNATLIRSENICPDPECQKKVQQGLNRELVKRQSFEKEKQQREEDRLRLKKNTS